MCNSAYLHSHRGGGNFCALKFWYTLRLLIAWLLLLLFVFLMEGGGGGGGLKKKKRAKPEREKIQEQTYVL